MEKEKDKRKNVIDKKLKEDKYGIIVEEDDYVIKSTYQPQLQPKPPLYIYLYI